MAPALAVIDALPKDAEVVYVGRKHPFEGDKGISLEYHIVTSRGIQFIPLTTGRLQRNLSWYTLRSLGKIPYGIAQAIKILRATKPDIIMGFGGYLSVPIGLAAKLFHIPLILHEQTQGAGLANKFLSKWATAVCISWQSSAKYFPKNKTVLTGNPLMKMQPNKEIASFLPSGDLPLLCVVGGSAGSHAINLFLEKHLDTLLSSYRIVHQTGDAQLFGDYERLTGYREQLSPEIKKRYILAKFIAPENIETLFSKADIVISRAGINTVTQLLLLQKPSLMIPLLTGQKNEQLRNAQFLQRMGLGEIFTDLTLSDQDLLQKLHQLKKKKIAKAAQEIVERHQHAAEKIISLLYENAAKKTKT